MGTSVAPVRMGWLAAFVVATALGACTDEKIVYRDRELFGPVDDAAQGFVGYTDAEDKLTVCGNCHVGPQSEWEGTAHADAWVTLQSSGHGQDFCEACHTVNALGNPGEGDAGYVAVDDARYHDVQCESCHGAGLPHIQNPGATQPMAPLAVGLDMASGCGECHQGAHHPFVEEWSESGHGVVNAYPAGRSACAGCHEAKAVLAGWGVDTEYLEKGSSEHLPIVCGVCHDPHSDTHEGQLRYAVDAPNEDENLCMKCHHKRGTPDPTTWRGPHSPEGPVLLGYAGWWPPNLGAEGGAIVATHGSEANPKLCAGCHVNSYEVTDPLTGEFVVNTTGHLFAATPCTDAQGVPQAGDCAPTERTFRTCTDAGCHGSEAVARSIMFTAEQRLENLADEVVRLLDQVQPGWQTCRTQSAGCGPFKSDGVYTTAEGAAFNHELALYNGSAVHNPFLMEALLLSTIRQLKTDYGVSVRASIVMDPLIGQ